MIASRTPRKAVLPALGAVLSFGLLLTAVAHAAGRPIVTTTNVCTVTVVVRQGDTLWSIAKRCDVPGDNVPEKVAAIRAANGLGSASLTPGQSLVVPVRKEAQRLAEGPSSGAPGEAPALEAR